MKRILQVAALALLVIAGSSWRNTASAQPGYDDDISYQDFYDDLSPHGRWIDYPEYGYVWSPSGIAGFRPYETGGHWIWTDDYQWMWVSDYSWGWATFHYGRWFHDPFYGWMWVPGYEWAPAWVAWRDGGDYYGWAPLRPGFNLSINISLGGYNPPVDYWCFAPRRYISSPRIYDYCIDRGRNVTIINNTTIINNYSRRNNVFINGPRRMDAERYAGRIQSTRFREASRPGRTVFRNNEVSVYRPRVRQDNNRQFRPGNFDRYERNGNTGRRNVFDRGNNNNNNGGISNRSNDRRNVFDRRSNDQQRGNREIEMRRQPSTDNRQMERERRRNVFDRGNGQQQEPGNRNIETRRQPSTDNRQMERERRRNVFDRGNGQQQQPGNRNIEMRRQPTNENRQFERRNERGGNVFDRQPSRQVERPQQQRQQPRQFENRSNGGGNREQRGGNNGNNGNGRRNVFDRRGG